jgi:hypothetical protein
MIHTFSIKFILKVFLFNVLRSSEKYSPGPKCYYLSYL